jgi:capsular exopolysaccharide synthesis family protein
MRKSKSVNTIDLKSSIPETYKTLRSNIQFSSLDKKIHTIVVTSPGPGEGKTTIASNLAITMAQAGNKTILIDCDLRKPSIHKAFNLSNLEGLSNLLIEEAILKDVIRSTEIENLHIITLGAKPPNPSELLSSSKMKDFILSLKEDYEYIIIDTPPVAMVTDAQILSQYADGCLLVVAGGETHKDAVIMAKELLTKVNAKILGVVLNKIDNSRKGYYYGYYNLYLENDDKKKKRGKKLSAS